MPVIYGPRVPRRGVYAVPAYDAVTHGTGLGIAEPCSPYRTIQIFGSNLNPSIPTFNCKAILYIPRTNFNLSAITINHEVVLELVSYDLDPGGYNIVFRWIRNADAKVIFTYTVPIAYAGDGYTWEYIYTYSYIGWLPDREITMNGSYACDVAVSTNHYTDYFTVSGIPATPCKASIYALSGLPASAKAGDSVSIAAVLQNIGGETGLFQAWVKNSNVGFSCIQPDPCWLDHSPGGTSNIPFVLQFTMPNNNASFQVTANHWNYDTSVWVEDAASAVLTVPLDAAQGVNNLDCNYVLA